MTAVSERIRLFSGGDAAGLTTGRKAPLALPVLSTKVKTSSGISVCSSLSAASAASTETAGSSSQPTSGLSTAHSAAIERVISISNTVSCSRSSVSAPGKMGVLRTASSISSSDIITTVQEDAGKSESADAQAQADALQRSRRLSVSENNLSVIKPITVATGVMPPPKRPSVAKRPSLTTIQQDSSTNQASHRGSLSQPRSISACATPTPENKENTHITSTQQQQQQQQQEEQSPTYSELREMIQSISEENHKLTVALADAEYQLSEKAKMHENEVNMLKAQLRMRDIEAAKMKEELESLKSSAQDAENLREQVEALVNARKRFTFSAFEERDPEGGYLSVNPQPMIPGGENHQSGVEELEYLTDSTPTKRKSEAGSRPRTGTAAAAESDPDAKKKKNGGGIKSIFSRRKTKATTSQEAVATANSAPTSPAKESLEAAEVTPRKKSFWKKSWRNNNNSPKKKDIAAIVAGTGVDGPPRKRASIIETDIYTSDAATAGEDTVDAGDTQPVVEMRNKRRPKQSCGSFDNLTTEGVSREEPSACPSAEPKEETPTTPTTAATEQPTSDGETKDATLRHPPAPGEEGGTSGESQGATADETPAQRERRLAREKRLAALSERRADRNTKRKQYEEQELLNALAVIDSLEVEEDQEDQGN